MKRNYPQRRTRRYIPLDEMTIRELKKQAAKFSGTTRPIVGYSMMDSVQLYAAILDRYNSDPVDVEAIAV